MIENKIKQLRSQKDITQEQLAENCGVSRQTIIAIEKGNYTPSLILAMQLARYFNLPVEDVFKMI